MSFDLKKDPWFIRVNSPEESAAVQKWLFEQGAAWFGGSKTVGHTSFSFLTNTCTSGKVDECLMGGVETRHIHASCKEIKVNFKSTLSVDRVEYTDLREKVEIGGKMYYKDDVENALSLLKPVEY